MSGIAVTYDKNGRPLFWNHGKRIKRENVKDSEKYLNMPPLDKGSKSKSKSGKLAKSAKLNTKLNNFQSQAFIRNQDLKAKGKQNLRREKLHHRWFADMSKAMEIHDPAEPGYNAHQLKKAKEAALRLERDEDGSEDHDPFANEEDKTLLWPEMSKRAAMERWLDGQLRCNNNKLFCEDMWCSVPVHN